MTSSSAPADTTCLLGCTGDSDDAFRGGAGGSGYRNGMHDRQGNGTRNGATQGQGDSERPRHGMGAGMGAGQNLPVSGTLSAAQLADLGAMAEEEKLAHDVYIALGEATGDARFTNIAAAEQRHLEAVRTLLNRYGQDDPTHALAAGEFAGADVKALYTDYVDAGRGSLEAALDVGRTIERLDIADLTRALEGLSAPDVQRVYTSLRAASEHHLSAFGG